MKYYKGFSRWQILLHTPSLQCPENSFSSDFSARQMHIWREASTYRIIVCPVASEKVACTLLEIMHTLSHIKQWSCDQFKGTDQHKCVLYGICGALTFDLLLYTTYHSHVTTWFCTKVIYPSFSQGPPCHTRYPSFPVTMSLLPS